MLRVDSFYTSHLFTDGSTHITCSSRTERLRLQRSVDGGARTSEFHQQITSGSVICILCASLMKWPPAGRSWARPAPFHSPRRRRCFRLNCLFFRPESDQAALKHRVLLHPLLPPQPPPLRPPAHHQHQHQHHYHQRWLISSSRSGRRCPRRPSVVSSKAGPGPGRACTLQGGGRAHWWATPWAVSEKCRRFISLWSHLSTSERFCNQFNVIFCSVFSFKMIIYCHNIARIGSLKIFFTRAASHWRT